jgi:hypothetical protein
MSIAQMKKYYILGIWGENILCGPLWAITLYITTLALGLRPRQRLARLQAKRKPRSEGKCEGMNLHTPKGASTLGVWTLDGLPMDSRIFRKRFQGSKLNGLESFLYH